MSWMRRRAKVSQLDFFDNPEIGFLGANQASGIKFYLNMQDELFFKRAARRYHEQLICPTTPSAITAGLLAKSTTVIKGATALTTAEQTITSFLSQPDVPRTLNFVSTSGCGDGTFVGANARIVKVTGTDIWGNSITEWVPLNATTEVQTKKAFASITSVVLPVEGDGTDTVAIGNGTGFALDYPILASADVLEFGVKASAATAYTVTALPTLAVGYARSTLSTGYSSSATSIVLATGGGSGFANGAQRTMAEIVAPDGTVEEIIITNRSTDTLTVVRGANGSTARAWVSGVALIARAPMTLTHALTADDRLRLGYYTYAL